MKEKRIICSMACGETSRYYSEYTFPLIQKYAKKCNADFYCMFQEDNNYEHLGQQKYNYINLLNYYDRVLHIDADILVRENTPNLFDIVLPDEFGGVNELPFENLDKEFPPVSRANEIINYNILGGSKSIQPKFYINVGMYLFSKIHKNIFFPGTLLSYFKEQSQINYRLHVDNIKMNLLPPQYNFMSLMKNAGLDKKNAYMIHYAGNWDGKTKEDVLQMMKEDL